MYKSPSIDTMPMNYEETPQDTQSATASYTPEVAETKERSEVQRALSIASELTRMRTAKLSGYQEA